MLVNSYIHMDPDAVAFLNAQGNTDAKEKYALNRLVVDLKQAGIWTKYKAIYPFLGSTAAFHKWNLKDPRDLDAAFRLVFFGGWTHTSNGALPNGTNAYADTKLNINSNLTITDNHISFYARTNNQNDAFGSEIGQNNAYGTGLQIISLRTRSAQLGGNQYYTIGEDNGAVFTTTNGLGFVLGVSSSISIRKVFQNGTQNGISTNINNGSLVNANALICRGDNVTNYSKNECAFSSFGDSLTNAEVLNYYNIVQRFQTTLGRQV
jgi:hypothetical protein